MNSDASVIRPVLHSDKGLAFAQSLLPAYSAIDAYHMTGCTIDEAVRRLIAVGADPEQIGGVDNFCWPDIQYHPNKNPDGKFKAAQLVRSCKALKETCLAYGIPLLSGKDSMYVDGHLTGPYGETRKVSALPTMQFSATGIVTDIQNCVTMDVKIPGDLIYILGITRDELGASEYYEHLGYIGSHVPNIFPEQFFPMYKTLNRAIVQDILASAHGIYRGGLAVHLAMKAMGGNLGMDIDLSRVLSDGVDRNDTLLFSESAGRLIVTIDPKNRQAFEKLFQDLPLAMIGTVTNTGKLVINGINDQQIISLSVQDLKSAWKRPFGDLI
jgi:phosphoribosylformylglycinamidine synthase